LENSRHRNRPPGLAQGRVDVGDVADAERDHIGVGIGVGQRQPLGVADRPGDLGRAALFDPGGDHLGVVVDDVDGGVRAAPALLGLAGHLGEAAGHVAGAAGAVDDDLARLRVQARGDRILPQPVHPAAHHVVHQVVVLGDPVEHAAHQPSLGRGVDVLESEGGGGLGHVIARIWRSK
jgi:hypothetical protein